MSQSLPERTWNEFIVAWHSKYVRTMKDGCRVYKERTKRGKRLVMLNWMKRYPYLFPKEALKSEGVRQ